MSIPTARQLYPPARLAEMDNGRLTTIFLFAYSDAREGNTTVYASMNREDTVATAWRTCSDIACELVTRVDKGDEAAQAALRQLARLL